MRLARVLSMPLAAVALCVAADDASPVWNIDYATSRIEFSGEQAGAQFTGHFADWQAAVQLDPIKGDTASFDVDIDLTSVTTGDSDRDATLAEDAWFGTATHPSARFQANGFDSGESGWVSRNATLTIKGRAHPISFEFKTAQKAGTNEVVLLGSARLSRLALGVGTGDWEDTEWVGDLVTVDVSIRAELADATGD
ncbi:MAG: YceI family protein [Pseudomonadota bacterium]